MAKTYRNKLNEYQLTLLNFIRNEGIRKSAMSILSYMLTVNKRKNDDYQNYQAYKLEKDPNKLKISFGEFHKLYIRNHQQISIRTLKNRINTLAELNLIVISKINNTNVYQFIFDKLCDVPKDIPKDVPKLEEDEPIDSTSLSENFNEHKYINSKTSIKDLDFKHCPDFDYEKYIDGERKICDLEVVINKMFQLFELFKVRSSYVKEKVRAQLSKYYTTITAKHLDLYVARIISNVQVEYHSYWKARKLEERKAAERSKPIAFVGNCPSRNYSDDEYTFMENKLLNWE